MSKAATSPWLAVFGSAAGIINDDRRGTTEIAPDRGGSGEDVARITRIPPRSRFDRRGGVRHPHRASDAAAPRVGGPSTPVGSGSEGHAAIGPIPPGCDGSEEDAS